MDSERGRLLFGIETELGFAISDARGRRVAPEDAIWTFFDYCARELVHLAGDCGMRLYLANGSLLYPDSGHPELATAECSSPTGLLQALRAGERLLTGVAEALEREKDIGTVLLYRTNVDYTTTDTTWGCHESYLSRREPKSYARSVVPHLASRIIYTGAGGFNTASSGVVFALSPRAFHVNAEVAIDGRGKRAIFGLRNEPLCASHHRVHLTCGEPNCAELGTYLKIGTTALVLAMADAGVDLGIGDGWIVAPVRAMQRFSLDPQCNASVQCSDDRWRAAIDIQRHYLERAERHCRASFMPPWAEDVCRRWREVLRALESDRDELIGVLDWPTKLALFKHYARTQSGLSWSAVGTWSSIAERISRVLATAGNRDERVGSREVRACLDRKGAHARLIRSMTLVLEQHGLEWDGLDAFHALRDALCELDMRYGQLHPRGLFQDLEEAGELRGRLLEPTQVDAALERAPEPGRARLRGDWIRKLANDDAFYRCSWTHITGEREYLELSDPFVTEVVWKPRRNCHPSRRMG